MKPDRQSVLFYKDILPETGKFCCRLSIREDNANISKQEAPGAEAPGASCFSSRIIYKEALFSRKGMHQNLKDTDRIDAGPLLLYNRYGVI